MFGGKQAWGKTENNTGEKGGFPYFSLSFPRKQKLFSGQKKNPLRFYYDPALPVIQKNILTKAIPPGQCLPSLSKLEGISRLSAPSP